MRRPFWVTLVAAIFLAAGIYLCSMAVVLAVMPLAISVVRRFPLMYGLRLVSPYLTLLIGVAWCCIGWGLLELKNWARITASALLGLGVFWELPRILSNHVHSGWSELGMMLEVVLRSAAAIYLLSGGVVELFERSNSPTV